MWHKDAIRDMPRNEASIANIHTHTYVYNLNLSFDLWKKNGKKQTRAHKCSHSHTAPNASELLFGHFLLFGVLSGATKLSAKSTAPMLRTNTANVYCWQKQQFINWITKLNETKL